MGSWKCGLCETEERWPSKQQALDHVEENHLDSLIRAAIERDEHDPTEDLPEHPRA
jgi:hypothetical protein